MCSGRKRCTCTVYKCCKTKAEEGTVMVFRLKHEACFSIIAVNRIFVPGKKMHKLFRGATKQQYDSQPKRKNDMCGTLQQWLP